MQSADWTLFLAFDMNINVRYFVINFVRIFLVFVTLIILTQPTGRTIHLLHNIIRMWAHICHICLQRWMLFVISRCHFCFFCQWQHFLRFHNMINDCKRTTTVRLLSSFYTSFLLHFTLEKEKWTHKLEYAHQVFSFFMIAAEHVLTFMFLLVTTIQNEYIRSWTSQSVLFCYLSKLVRKYYCTQDCFSKA